MINLQDKQFQGLSDTEYHDLFQEAHPRLLFDFKVQSNEMDRSESTFLL